MRTLIVPLLFVSLAGCHGHTDRPDAIRKIAALPAFDIQLIDSASHLNSRDIPGGLPTLFLFFSTDCEHCQRLTRNILRNMNSFRHAQIYMLTIGDIPDLKDYYRHFGLGAYKNITVGRDDSYAFFNSFKPLGFPYIAIYDEHKKLMKIYKGEVDIDILVSSLKG